MSNCPEYPKIRALWRRESERPCRVIPGAYSMPEFELLKGIDWYWTEKVDGTNVRVHWDGHRVSWYGRSDRAQLPVRLTTTLEELFGGPENEQLFEQTFGDKGVTLYGEGFGAGIQKGGDYSPEVRFVLFDVLIDGLWLDRLAVVDVAQQLAVEVVPIVGRGTLEDAVEYASKARPSHWGTATSEGVVAKPAIELRTRRGERIIVKLKLGDLAGCAPNWSP